MTYFFTPSGQIALAAFVDTSTLFAFDLDGTLAPIVPNPDEIAIPEDVRQALIQLDSMAPVAIITGRPRADAMTHLRFSPRYLVGNHGAEGLPGSGSDSLDFVRLSREWKDQLYMLLPHMAEQGISLDDKGHTLSLHYRTATDQTAAREEISGYGGRGGWMIALREKLYIIIFESDTRAGRVFDLALIFFILLSVVMVMLDSIPKSIYWAIVTMTTVGYGDIAPATPLGLIVASLLMIIGYGIIAVPTGIVTSEMMRPTPP